MAGTPSGKLPPDEFNLSGPAYVYTLGKITPPWPIGKSGFGKGAIIVPQRTFTLDELTVGDNEIIGFRMYWPNPFTINEPFVKDTIMIRPNGTEISPEGTPTTKPGSKLWLRSTTVFAGPPYEIDQLGIYTMLFKVISSDIFSGEIKVYFEVVEPTPPEEPLPGFWEGLKDLWNDALKAIAKFLSKKVIEALDLLHDLLFLTRIDEETARRWAEHVPGFEALHAYAFGTDLDGLAIPELKDVDTVDMVVALIPMGTGPAIKLSEQLFKRGLKPLTQKFMANIVAKEAEIIGKGVGGKALQKQIEQEMLRQAARDIIASKPAWKQIITLTGPVARWMFAASSMMGLGAWAAWPVADNLSTMLSIDGRTMLSLVKDGSITKEEALAKLKKMEVLFDEGQRFVDLQTAINPIVRFLTPTFKLATDAARLLYDQTLEQIEALEPVTPPGDIATITFNSVPSGAKVSIDDVTQFGTTPVSLQVEPGERKITYKLFGYEDISGTFTFQPGEIGDINMTLTVIPPPPPGKGTLVLEITPDNAVVEVTGQPQITAAGNYELDPGSYSIKVSREGFFDKVVTAIIKENITTPMSVILTARPPPAPEKGTLHIAVSPADALIEIVTLPEITSAGTYEVDPGSYAIRASREGFFDRTVTIFIDAGETETVSITLPEIPEPPPPPPGKGTLTINSSPQGAKIYIDGTYRFTLTPYTVLLDPGSYLIRLELHGYETTEESVSVAEDKAETYTKALTLFAIPPLPPVPPVVPPITPPTIPPTIPPIFPAPTPPIVPVPFVPGQVVPSTPAIPGKRRLALNIETSGFRPLDHKLIAIGYQDADAEDIQPTVIMMESEEEILKELFRVIDEGNYNELIGYGLSFDFRFIVVKAMKYGIPCQQFADMEIYDLMQAIAQVKFKFVYFPQRALKLSDVADFFWGYPKPFTDLEMLKYWKSGRQDKVVEFTTSQITRILLLYSLFRSITENPFIADTSGIEGSHLSSETTLVDETTSPLTILEANAPLTWTAKCPNDLSEHEVPMNVTEFKCPIDGTIIKKP